MLHPTYHGALPVIRTLVQVFLPFVILAAFCLSWVAAYCILRRRSSSQGIVVGREWLGRTVADESLQVAGQHKLVNLAGKRVLTQKSATGTLAAGI